jgi:hypothetical protein
MDRTVLAGRCVRVVEDEVLIALDIAESLRAAGAAVSPRARCAMDSALPRNPFCPLPCSTSL